MSLTATRWAHKQRRPLTQKMILLLMADRARLTPDGYVCWPSIERLAEDGGMCERAARDAVRSLEADRLIHTISRPGRSSIYVLAVPPPRQQGPARAASRAPEPIKESITESAGAADVWVAFWRRRVGEGLDAAGRERLSSLIRAQSPEAWEAIEREESDAWNRHLEHMVPTAPPRRIVKRAQQHVAEHGIHEILTAAPAACAEPDPLDWPPRHVRVVRDSARDIGP